MLVSAGLSWASCLLFSRYAFSRVDQIHADVLDYHPYSKDFQISISTQTFHLSAEFVHLTALSVVHKLLKFNTFKSELTVYSLLNRPFWHLLCQLLRSEA